MISQRNIHRFFWIAFSLVSVCFAGLIVWIILAGYEVHVLWLSLAALTCLFVGDMNRLLMKKDE